MNQTPIKYHFAIKEFPGGVVAKVDGKRQTVSVYIESGIIPPAAIREEITWWAMQELNAGMETNDTIYDQLWKEPELCNPSTP